MVNRLVIVGVGLIGGSLALALRKAGFSAEIIGVGRSSANLELAKRLKIIDRIENRASDAVRSADLVVLAVPVAVIRSVLEEIGPFLPASAVVTDVGSVKSGVMTDAKKILGESVSRFIPGHPIAGSDEKGAESSFAGLFLNHYVLLTPSKETDPKALALVEDMWVATGAHVALLNESKHDHNLAFTSHLPHILSYSLMNVIEKKGGVGEFVGMMGGGFRDTTRIASSDPEIWTDIILANRDEILHACSLYKEQLAEFLDALIERDESRIFRFIERAKKARDDCIIPDANDD